MSDKQNIQDIMIILKRKFNDVEQIQNYTKDMLESMNQNDFDTLNLLLDMRASLIDKIASYDDIISEKISNLNEDDRIKITCQISDSYISSNMSFEESTIKDLHIMTKNKISQILEMDDLLQKKISAKSKLLSIENS